jgi:hypothetical protein
MSLLLTRPFNPTKLLLETKEGIEARSIELYKACVLALGASGLKFGQVKQDFFL